MIKEQMEEAIGTLYHAALAITSAANFLHESLPIPPGEKKLIKQAIAEAQEALKKIEQELVNQGG